MTPFPHRTNRVSSPEQARAVQAYLLTISEDYSERPVYGDTFMKEVITAFSSPNELRAILPSRLRGRYDRWLQELQSEQYDLFVEY
jgi:hypothetical protein